MSVRKILKYFGLMKIEDAKEILIKYSEVSHNSLRQWIKEDAPNLYEKWKDDAGETNRNYAKFYFGEIEKSEWFVRSK